MLKHLKEIVYEANMALARSGLVLYTWGNVSGIDREANLMAIKPSGVPYSDLSARDIVLVDVEDGKIAEGALNPSSDTPTHLVLYRAFEEIGGVAHTHSSWAASFAQAGRDVPALGTTHADYFHGEVPCTRDLTETEVLEAYELNTGKVIVETFLDRRLDPGATPGALVAGHGPFTWGDDASAAVYHAVVLEQVSLMAAATLSLNPGANLPGYVLDKHYLRKHGPSAYYGQGSHAGALGEVGHESHA